MFTLSQLNTLKSAILADPNLNPQVANGETGYIASYLNQPSSTTVWSTVVKVQDIYDAIVWANFTPASTIDSTQLWANRALACQGKQFNLQTMLTGRDVINGSKSNIRAGLQDALTGIPSKADGTNQNAGWTSVQLVLQRFATNGEKVFVTGGSPGTLGWEGEVTNNDVVAALNGGY